MIKFVPIVALLAVFSSGVANASGDQRKPEAFPFTGYNGDCSASIRRTWPHFLYDARTGDRIFYDVGRCTGGYIRGENSSRSWHVKIDDHLNISGVDMNGDHWKYDRAAGRYVNLSTGRACATSSVRNVCPLHS